jgi:Lrp/AsnC family transcriptional regulator, leucine-responsive regulatory protein
MPKISLTPVDRRILRLLQEDGRITNAELAERVGLSPSPCLRRVRLLEEAGIISRYVTLLDPEALGLGVAAFVEIRLGPKNTATAAAFEAAIKKYSEIMECHIMTGEYDYLLRIVVPDIPSLRAFVMNQLLSVPGVEATRSSFSLGQVKYTTALPLDVEEPVPPKKRK